jgi:hypothetical protein
VVGDLTQPLFAAAKGEAVPIRVAYNEVPHA